MSLRNLFLCGGGLLALSSLACASGGSRPPPAPRPEPIAAVTDEPPPMKPLWYGAQGRTDPKSKDDRSKQDQATRRRGRVVPVPKADRPRSNENSPLGTNLAALGGESADWVFVDAFKQSTPWVSMSGRSGKKDNRKLDVDDEGWVRQLLPDQSAATRFPTMAGGTLVVLYEGRGKLVFEGATVESDQPGRFTIITKRDSEVQLVIATSNPADPVRQIRVVPPAFEATYEAQVFHPMFLRRLSRFKVLRMGGWGRVDESALVRWSDRPLRTHATQASSLGVAYEYMIMLANELRADLWINVPHLANDEYLTSLGELLRDNLEPELKVYLEYSNELYGAPEHSAAAAYVNKQAKSLDPDPNLARAKYAARRSVALWQRMEPVLDRGRTVRVLSGRLASNEELEALLSFEKAYEQADALAVNPRFGAELGRLEFADAVESNDLDWLLSQLDNDSLPEVLGQVRRAAEVAKKYGVALVAASGGQGLVADIELRSRATLNERFDAANRNPRMGALYGALLDGWQKYGGELFVHQGLTTPFGKYGRFGALELQDQSEERAPKFQALLAFADNHPRWWREVSPPPGAPRGLEPPPAPPPGPELVPPPATLSLQTDAEPRSRTGVWIAGGLGVAGAATGWLMQGLFLNASHQRDRALVATYFPPDGTVARGYDDQAFQFSLLGATGFGVGGAGLLTATALWLMEEEESDEQRVAHADELNPAVWLAAANGAVALLASGAYFWGYNNSASARDDLLALDPNPGYSAPVRELDDEAFRYSLASVISLGVAGASAGLAFLFHWLDLQAGFTSYESLEQ